MKMLINIEGSLHRQLKAKSAMEGTPMQNVVVKLIEQYVGGKTVKPSFGGNADAES